MMSPRPNAVVKILRLIRASFWCIWMLLVVSTFVFNPLTNLECQNGYQITLWTVISLLYPLMFVAPQQIVPSQKREQKGTGNDCDQLTWKDHITCIICVHWLCPDLNKILHSANAILFMSCTPCSVIQHLVFLSFTSPGMKLTNIVCSTRCNIIGTGISHNN